MTPVTNSLFVPNNQYTLTMGDSNNMLSLYYPQIANQDLTLNNISQMYLCVINYILYVVNALKYGCWIYLIMVEYLIWVNGVENMTVKETRI